MRLLVPRTHRPGPGERIVLQHFVPNPMRRQRLPTFAGFDFYGADDIFLRFSVLGVPNEKELNRGPKNESLLNAW